MPASRWPGMVQNMVYVAGVEPAERERLAVAGGEVGGGQVGVLDGEVVHDGAVVRDVERAAGRDGRRVDAELAL